MKISVAAAFTALALPCVALCQPPPAPRFEVASVKPSDGSGPIDMKTDATRLSATNFPLLDLILAAWSVERWQVTGGPVWLDSDRFEVEAKTDEDLSADPDRVVVGGRPAPRKMMLMLQTLLAERFNVKVHRETRQDNVFALTVAKNGPKLQAPKDTNAPPFIGIFRTGPLDAAALTVIIGGQNASMEQLANYLQGNMRRPVVDQTGIEGNYDFRIEYAPDDSPAVNFSPLFTALQDAAGLKLNASKGPVEFLMVDHADKPSAN